MDLAEPPELQTRVNDRVYGPMIRDLLEQGVAAGEFEVADVDLTSRFVQAIGMEAVRQIHDDPESRPEEATVQAIRRLITGESAAPAPAKKNKKKPRRSDGVRTMTQVLVAYGTRYGSTREVAEAVAATLEEQGIDTDVKTAREVRSLDGYDAVVLGTPLYMGALHKDVRALLEKNRAALEHTPFALFALGPIKADDGIDGSREQLFTRSPSCRCRLRPPRPSSSAPTTRRGSASRTR